MKKILLALAAVAFLAAPAMAQAEPVPVPQPLAAQGYTADAWLEDAVPEQSKYCPGVKKAKKLRFRLRNYNRATVIHKWIKASACASGGKFIWKNVTTGDDAPSIYWSRVGSGILGWHWCCNRSAGAAFADQIFEKKAPSGWPDDWYCVKLRQTWKLWGATGIRVYKEPRMIHSSC